MEDIRLVNIMEQEIGDGQHIGELLFFDAMDGACPLCAFGREPMKKTL